MFGSRLALGRHILGACLARVGHLLFFACLKCFGDATDRYFARKWPKHPSDAGLSDRKSRRNAQAGAEVKEYAAHMIPEGG